MLCCSPHITGPFCRSAFGDDMTKPSVTCGACSLTTNAQSVMTTPYRFVAADERSKGFKHVLLITTGSVASVKAPLIVQELLKVLSDTGHYQNNQSDFELPVQ
jgi:hypothetical protein